MSDQDNKGLFGGLFSIFKRRESVPDNESSDGVEAATEEGLPNDLSDGGPVSPLAMMSENSPEAWLGQFLTILGAPPALQASSLKAASQDERLLDHLRNIRRETSGSSAEALLLPGEADRLKESDWAAWWRAQEALARWCYSTLSLAMLGEQGLGPDVSRMYNQEANSRIKKDAHYVACYLLGRDWRAHTPTPTELARLP